MYFAKDKKTPQSQILFHHLTIVGSRDILGTRTCENTLLLCIGILTFFLKYHCTKILLFFYPKYMAIINHTNFDRKL